ncbi:MAG: NnrS family protein [Magnetococcales bacterium]|nr:NnrS family protein [Magnetococcales bacterium]
MRRIIQIIAPADPPFTPMNFTRLPIVHRFWYGGLAAGLAGFFLGFGLWLWQHGQLGIAGDYFFFKLLHARIQIEGFVGSFLLGFALQSGPHVTGGKPPASEILLKLLYLLWAGLALLFLPVSWLAVVGSLLVSGAYGGAGYLLLRVTLAGNPALRIPRGLPLALGMGLMAITPWLELDDPGVALFVLWCGPVTVALVAAQQLIQNVVGGRFLQKGTALAFALALLAAWLVSGAAAFAGWGSWRLAGVAWLVVLAILLIGTDYPRAAWRFGWASIQVTLSLGFAYALATASLLAVQGAMLDSAVHLLAAGMLTTLIMGVTVRVAGFFSAGAVLPDRLATILLVAWGVIALVRAFSPVWPMEERWIALVSLLGGAILLTWGSRTAYRLSRIHLLLPESVTGRRG